MGKKKKSVEIEPAESGSDRVPTSFRFSTKGKEMADELSKLLGVNRTSVMEMAIRHYYRLHFHLPDEKK